MYFAVTDFPDIRLKAAIQSASGGNLLIIPREGGYLVRFYVDLGDVTPQNRNSIKQITVGSHHRYRATNPASLFAGREGSRVVFGVPRWDSV